MGRRVHHSSVLLLVGTALALLGAGCGGGGSKSTSSSPAAGAAQNGFSAYEVKMQQLGQTLGRALLDLGSANKTATPAVVVKDLRKAQVQLRSAADKLTAITPPAKIKAQHQLLIKGVREYASELDGVITKYKKGNKQAIYAVADLKGVKDMGRATVAISKAGYVITIG
jgi:hypothetical protein